MLFGKKKCTKCESEYDVVLDTCPACHEKDEQFEKSDVSKKILWLPILKQILLFAFGWLGLNILSLLAEIIALTFTSSDDVSYYMFVNMVRYLGVLIAMAILLWNNFPTFKRHFNKWFPYVIGIVGGIAMIATNIVWGNIVNLFYTPEANQNQAVANSLVDTYPILCIFLLGIIGPVVEEFTYRVGLFSFFSRINKYLAYAITIVIFALIHFNFFAKGDDIINELWNLPVYMIGGFLLTLWYDKWGITSSLTAHIFNNLYSVLITILVSNIK